MNQVSLAAMYQLSRAEKSPVFNVHSTFSDFLTEIGEGERDSGDVVWGTWIPDV